MEAFDMVACHCHAKGVPVLVAFDFGVFELDAPPVLHLPGEDRLCTAVCLLLEQHGTEFSVRSVAAGHPLPLVLRAGDGSVQPLAGSGTLLGAVPDLHLGEASTTLTPGDSVLLYTDGATEARAPRHDGVELFGESALRATLASARGHDATAIAATITKAVQTFSGGALTDDLALLVLRVDGA